MNIKSILGTTLGLLGIIGLLYTVLLYTNNTNGEQDFRLLIIYGILGAGLLTSGFGLIESVKDK